MNQKDFPLGESDHLEYAYRLPVYSTMELYIETLTGTCFELRVSPYETVISVKAKIQRLEGIPITQQYLIWQNMELEDEYCLHDYNITDGCTLKLVLAMRGGPINTRRIAMEEPSLRDMADYMESNREELFDKLTPPPSGGNSNKQVTLLVYRDGDQLNFFRVVDRGDGTLTPFSESLSGSACNLREEEEDTDEDQTNVVRRSSPGQSALSIAQMVENNVTASKMKQVRAKMRSLDHQLPTSQETKSVSAKKTETNLTTGDKSLQSQSTLREELIEKLRLCDSDVTKQHDAAGKDQPDSAEAKSDQQPSSNTKAELLRNRLMRVVEENRDMTSSVNAEQAKQAERSEVPPTQQTGICAQDSTPNKPPPIAATRLVKPTKVQPITGPELTAAFKDQQITCEKEFTIQPATETTQVEKEPSSGRFSPKTRRLLNALDKQPAVTSRRPSQQHPPPVPIKPDLLQGMTFNRHDLYLRSYGLIQSPDRVLEQSEQDTIEVVPSPSPTPLVGAGNEEGNSAAPKVYETPHGVKYSALGSNTASSRAPYYFGRLLKTPPVWAPPNEESATSGWHPVQRARSGKKGLKPLAESSRAFSNLVGANVPAPPNMTGANFPGPPRKPPLLDIGRRRGDEEKLIPHPPAVTRFNRRSNSLVSADPDDEEMRMAQARKLPPPPDNLRVKEAGKMESMTKQEAREVVDFINKAVDASILRNLVRSPNKESSISQIRGDSGRSAGRFTGTAYHRNTDSARNLMRSSHGGTAGQFGPERVTSQPRPQPPLLPPVKAPNKKKRCFLCGKRTGLATSYLCRCGNNFCASHRYAETHSCTFDYKTAGRKILEEANPLVSAPKLPKI